MVAGKLTLLAGLLSYVFYNSVLPFLILWLPGFRFYAKRSVLRLRDHRKEKLKKEFLFAAGLLGDYLRSGYSVENAIVSSETELRQSFGSDSDILREWHAMGTRMRLNLTAEEVFRDFAGRAHIQEIQDFAEIFEVVKRSGGQLSEVISRVTDMLAESFAVEEQIKTALAAKKLEQKIMNLMPVGILLYIRISSGDLLTVMYTTWLGRLVMTGCLGLYAAAYLWAEKILKIEI